MAILIGCVAEPCLNLNSLGAFCADNAATIGGIRFLSHEGTQHDGLMLTRSHFVVSDLQGRDVVCAWVVWTKPYTMRQAIEIRDKLLSFTMRAR